MKAILNHIFLLLMLRHNGFGLPKGRATLSLLAVLYLVSIIIIYASPYRSTYLVPELLLGGIAAIAASSEIGSRAVSGFLLIWAGVHEMIHLTPFINQSYWFWWGVLSFVSLLIRIVYVAPHKKIAQTD